MVNILPVWLFTIVFGIVVYTYLLKIIEICLYAFAYAHICSTENYQINNTYVALNNFNFIVMVFYVIQILYKNACTSTRTFSVLTCTCCIL